MNKICKFDLDTPCLILYKDKLEKNIQKMANFFSDKKARLRPHMKTHKSPIIAMMQLKAGALGITCAKLDEAETLISAGVQDILIANQVVGSTKISRLMELSTRNNLMVAVDSDDNITALNNMAIERGVKSGVLLEIDVGMDRCGVSSDKKILHLTRKIIESKGLIFKGIMGYEGHAVSIVDYEERRRLCNEANNILIRAKELIEKDGIPVEIVSAGGTGTYNISGIFPGITEIQAGSYVVNDSTYYKVVPEFEIALTLMTTVISRPSADRIIIDAGMKAVSNDMGLPEVKGLQGATVLKLSEEHGKIQLSDTSLPVKPGKKIELIPSHCCTTINLHEHYHIVENDRVEDIWPIEARGGFR